MTKQFTAETRARNSPRGYLLIEAVIGGAMVAVALGIVFSQIAAARSDVIYGQRHAIASSQAAAKAAELAGASVITVQPLNAFQDIDPVAFPGMQVRWSVTLSAINAASTPPIAANLFDVNVEVKVPANNAAGFDIIQYQTIQKD